MVLTSPQVINGTTVPVGTYIKGDLIATGSITADKIDTRGLSIRDANGNVLFGSGTALDVANITGLGSLATKSSLTSSDIGGLGALATKDKVTTNEVTGLGTLATKSSLTTGDVGGLGTLATKNSVTTSEVTGLGDLAKVDKLTTSNITTYVDGLGVRNLLVGDAQITTANIGTAQVDTLQIAGEAVVVPRSQYNPNSVRIEATRTYTLLHTISMTTVGNVISISIGFEGISGYAYGNISDNLIARIRVTRDGLNIKEVTLIAGKTLDEDGGGSTHSLDFSLLNIPNFLDIPPAGNHTYQLWVYWGGESYYESNDTFFFVTGTSMQLLGVKR